MKIIEKKSVTRPEDKEKLIADIHILKHLDHPNILKLYEFYQDEKSFYIIYEYCAGGELFDKIIELGCLGEQEASYILRQILSAIVYAHNHNIVHRDLKPENILLDIAADGSYMIKVVDWGTAREYDPNNKMNEKYGTAYYMAPEVLKKNYDAKCDIWSCGVILYIMLCGKPPFAGRNETEIMKNVLKGKYTLEGDAWSVISEEAKDLVQKMLEYDPAKRLSALEAYEHVWFKVMATAMKLPSSSKELMKASMTNLRSFRAEQKMQQMAITFMASNLSSNGGETTVDHLVQGV
jgi:calcium-dependent protein kinase